MKRWSATIGILLLATSCQKLDQAGQLGATVGVLTGTLTPEQAAALERSTAAIARTAEDLTPEQEYYIGRAVAANILQRYAPLADPEVNRYINTLGQGLALVSRRPETFGGYRFLVLDSDEINAFAAPGGLIFVTRGMLRCCPREDAIAAVLAHEIAHVQFRHGLRAIQQSRLTTAFTVLAAEGAKTFGSRELAELTSALEGTISDVTHVLLTSGYARDQEEQADRGAVEILMQAGYDPHALIEMLEEMKRRLKPGGLDFAKTHPDPGERIRRIQRMLPKESPPPAPPARHERFVRIMRKI